MRNTDSLHTLVPHMYHAAHHQLFCIKWPEEFSQRWECVPAKAEVGYDHVPGWEILPFVIVQPGFSCTLVLVSYSIFPRCHPPTCSVAQLIVVTGCHAINWPHSRTARLPFRCGVGKSLSMPPGTILECNVLSTWSHSPPGHLATGLPFIFLLCVFWPLSLGHMFPRPPHLPRLSHHSPWVH